MLRQHSLGVGQVVGGWTLLLVVVFLVLVPGLVSVASAHDNLLRKDRQEVGVEELGVAAWMLGGGAADDVVIIEPEPPWFIPLMTGKAILRADDYWLSPDDDALADLKKAYAGDRDAQARSLQKGDYLVLRVDEIDKWEPLNYARVYKNEKYVVWDLGKGSLSD